MTRFRKPCVEILHMVILYRSSLVLHTALFSQSSASICNGSGHMILINSLCVYISIRFLENGSLYHFSVSQTFYVWIHLHLFTI
jgi:hypothetical protein